MSNYSKDVTQDTRNFSDREFPVSHAGSAIDYTSLTDVYITVVMLSVFALVGSTGNAIVLCVMSSRRDKLTSTMFIMVLAAVDFMTCVFIVPFTVAMEWVNFRISSDFVCRLYIFLTTFNIPFSSLLVASIAVDRYLCICHPFWHKANVTRFRWIIGIAVLWLSSGGFGLTVSLMHSVYAYDFSVDMDDGNITTLEMWRRSDNNNTISDDDTRQREMIAKIVNIGHCRMNDMIISTEVKRLFQKCYHGVLLGCLLVICILYPLIYRSVRHGRQLREKRILTASSSVASKSKKQRPVTDHMALSCDKIMKTEVRQDVAMTATTTKSADIPTTVGLQVNPLSTGDGRITKVGVTSDGWMAKDHRVESIVRDTVVTGCSQHKRTEENNRIVVEQHAVDDTNNDVGTAELLTMTMTPGDMGRNYSAGKVMTAIHDQINVQVMIPSTRLAENVTDTRSTNAELFSGSNCPSGWGECSEKGTCHAEETAPNNEHRSNTATHTLALHPLYVSSEVNICSTRTTCVVSAKPAAITETVDVMSSVSVVDTMPKTYAIRKASLSTSVNGATSSSTTQKNTNADAKTAAMLFVVTFVFALTFLPAVGMSLGLVKHNTIMFYMYFFNFVANPIIYSFMSENFRKQLKGLFCTRR